MSALSLKRAALQTFTRMCWSSFRAPLSFRFTISVVTEGEWGTHRQRERETTVIFPCCMETWIFSALWFSEQHCSVPPQQQQLCRVAAAPCSRSDAPYETPQYEWNASGSSYEGSIYRTIFCSSCLQETNAASLFSDVNNDALWSVNTHIHLSRSFLFSPQLQ